MQLVIEPPHVGPIKIGMAFDDAQKKLCTISGYIHPEPRPGFTPVGYAHYDSGMSISISPSRGGEVKSIEVYRPDQGVNVFFRGVSVFETPADEVVQRIVRMVRLETQDGGLLVVAPELLLAMGRRFLPEETGGEEGKYFESILVASPGYYGDILDTNPVSL